MYLLLCPHSPLGDKYWVFKEVTAEPGYPHSLVELGSCLPREGIDTALRWEPVGKTYFFKGDRYWRYNEDKRATDPGYPKPITVWRGIPQAPQGAFISKEGCMCLQALHLLDQESWSVLGAGRLGVECFEYFLVQESSLRM